MKYAIRSLKVRSESGRLVEQADTVSTDFVRDAAVGLQSVPDSEILEPAFRILARRMAKGSVLTSPKDTQRYLTLRFAELEHEVFAVVYLTKRHRVIACEELFRGTIDGASVHPRIVVKNSLRQRRGCDRRPQSSVGNRGAKPGRRDHHSTPEGRPGAGGHTPARSFVRWILKCHHRGQKYLNFADAALPMPRKSFDSLMVTVVEGVTEFYL
jgi:hypothetical protein